MKAVGVKSKAACKERYKKMKAPSEGRGEGNTQRKTQCGVKREDMMEKVMKAKAGRCVQVCLKHFLQTPPGL